MKLLFLTAMAHFPDLNLEEINFELKKTFLLLNETLFHFTSSSSDVLVQIGVVKGADFPQSPVFVFLARLRQQLVHICGAQCQTSGRAMTEKGRIKKIKQQSIHL